MIRIIRKSKLTKVIAINIALLLLFQIAIPNAAFALTGGPSQPEVQSFEPVATTDMVNVFSGDFTYNIPLMDVGGYPVNLFYNSGISMDQEASWVGLGWNINPGVILRNVRGLPDDFAGDIIKKEYNLKNNTTYGVSAGLGFEAFGIPLDEGGGLSLGIGIQYNNYKGMGMNVSADINVGATSENSTNLCGGLGLSSGTDGFGVSATVGFQDRGKNTENGDKDIQTTKVGLGYNSRTGLKELTLERSSLVKYTKKDGTNNYKSYNGGSSISFGTPTYTTSSDMPLLNASISVSLRLGSAIFGAHVNGRIKGFFSTQFISDKNEDFPSYGYMYSQLADINDRVLLDYNREKDGPFSKETPVLPVTNYTYDIYSVNGQGIGGFYRPFRSEVGILTEPKNGNYSAGLDLGGIEIGFTQVNHTGLTICANTSITTTGMWNNGNEVKDELSFSNTNSSPLYEACYFKQAGEKCADDDLAFLSNIGGFDPVRVKLNKTILTTTAKKIFIDDDANNDNIHSGGSDEISTNIIPITRNQRAKRNEGIQILKAGEYKGCVDENIKTYSANSFTLDQLLSGDYYAVTPNASPIARTTYPSTQISEISAVKADGSRYIYGIPAYNTQQEEVSFAVDGPDANTLSDGLVNFNNTVDNSKDNNKALDHFYSRTSTPAYAYAYLLTSVLSSDYVDMDGIAGPSDGDNGNYTKINYSRISDYKWRVPYVKANYNEGLKSLTGNEAHKGDDKANYLYGKKDIWYIHSIETKTHIAYFTLNTESSNPRQDARAASDEAGSVVGSSNGRQRYLTQIDLYSKADLIKAKNNILYTAKPVKTVHFTYDYSLCSGIHNSQGTGKLTLKTVYFTYGDSKKGQLSPYQFTYCQNFINSNPVNPSYNIKGYDRWGNYMGNPIEEKPGPVYTSEFPYTDQRISNGAGTVPAGKYYADYYAIAWNLTSIKLPSGGNIEVNYESDDYAYVQDKRAMQMFNIVGYSNSPNSTISDLSATLNNDPDEYLYFSMSTVPNNLNEFARDYLKDENGQYLEWLYFRFLLKIGGTNNDKEFIPGYVKIDYAAANPFGFNGNLGYVKLSRVDMNLGIHLSPYKVNPISQAGWNFTLIRRPDIISGGNPNQTGVLQVLQFLASTVTSVLTAISGSCTVLDVGGNSKQFDTNKSYIRLYNPTWKKKGGGARVKQIKMVDNWTQMTTPGGNYQNASYGFTYDYTTKTNDGRPISSGVASYEPMIGNDENPFRQPIFVTEKNVLAADNKYFIEEPMGECFFPAPSVGYSKVTIRSIAPSTTENPTGYTVQEFYTAKDFPVITHRTNVDPQRNRTNPVFKLLKVKCDDFMTASQGYSIELNDMHGKPKAQWVYRESNGIGDNDTKISGVEYKYFTDNNNKLKNNIPALAKDGTFSDKMMGVDYDFIVDMRQHNTNNIVAIFGGNVNSFLAAVFPAIIPSFFPGISREHIRFRSAVTTKVINRSGLLKEVINYDLGSKVSAQNLCFDPETGEVLLTKTVNEFNDPVYSFTYPAHWAYDGMGPAYMNIGKVLLATSASPDVNGYLTSDVGCFANGDVILNETNSELYWIQKDLSTCRLIKSDGSPVTNIPNSILKIIRSGRKNQQNIPISTLALSTNPINSNPFTNDFINDKILNATAIEYTDEAKVYCNCNVTPGADYNPFVIGLRGNWRPLRQWSYLDDRMLFNNVIDANVPPPATPLVFRNTGYNTDIRKDGYYKHWFLPFWEQANGEYIRNTYVGTPTRWQSPNEVTMYDPHGNEMENKNALGVYSSAVYGYNFLKVLSVASNAKLSENAFDNFEDYHMDNCPNDHFSFEASPDPVNVTEDYSHSGRRSIKVMPQQSVSITKQLQPCP